MTVARDHVLEAKSTRTNKASEPIRESCLLFVEGLHAARPAQDERRSQKMGSACARKRFTPRTNTEEGSSSLFFSSGGSIEAFEELAVSVVAIEK
ncbi:hypothetical protein CEP53_015121 [Fusarium sp. AF-6]|nr:hypothetical protein CEP53_015121 [Fusarium sp. AF-6]